MNSYIITMVETNVYDIHVEAESLDHAKDLAKDSDESTWARVCGSAELGDDHTMLNGEVWVNV